MVLRLLSGMPLHGATPRACSTACARHHEPKEPTSWGCCERWAEDGQHFSPGLHQILEPGRGNLALRRIVPNECRDVSRVLMRAVHDVSRVPNVSSEGAADLIERMWRPKGKHFDSPRIQVQVAGGVGYVVRAQPLWRSRRDPVMLATHRIRPVLRAIRDALREHEIPDVSFIIDLDDKNYERHLPIMAFSSLHTQSSWNSSALLVPDWTSSPAGSAMEARSDPWSGNLTQLMAVDDMFDPQAWRPKP